MTTRGPAGLPAGYFQEDNTGPRGQRRLPSPRDSRGPSRTGRAEGRYFSTRSQCRGAPRPGGPPSANSVQRPPLSLSNAGPLPHFPREPASGEQGAFSGTPSPLPGDGPHQTGRVSRTQAPAPNLLRRTPNPPSLGPAGSSSCGEISSPCAPCWPVGATSASVGAPGASPGSALSRWAAFCADPWHLAGTDPKARDRP